MGSVFVFEQNKLLPILNNNTLSEFNAVHVKKIKRKSDEKYVVKRVMQWAFLYLKTRVSLKPLNSWTLYTMCQIMSGSIFTLRLAKINILFGCFKTLNITPKICCPVLITQLLPTQKLTCMLWTLTYVTSLATSDNTPSERQRDIQLHQHKSILNF